MGLIFQSSLQPFLGKALPDSSNGLLADIQHLADFSIRLPFIDFEQNMGSLDDHGFVATFGYDPNQLPSFFFLQMDFMLFVCHPSILSLPYNLIKLRY